MKYHVQALVLVALSHSGLGFMPTTTGNLPATLFASTDSDSSVRPSNMATSTHDLPVEVARQFKILTCTSTSCSAKRKQLGLDDYSTFSAFYSRAQDRAPCIQVEECPCLGQCQTAPCVAIEHQDYEGTVSLEGMTPSEFANRVFSNICWEEDADRVWHCVENAIRIMAVEEGDDDDDGNDGGNEEYAGSEGVAV